MSTVLFTGRFDKPHVGHIINIQRLGQKFDTVIVCVLDDGKQFYPVKDRMQILIDALENSKGNYVVISNKTNFEQISSLRLKSEVPPFDVYASGNWTCVQNIRNMGYKTIDVSRYPGYAAKTDRVIQKIIAVIEKEFDTDIKQ